MLSWAFSSSIAVEFLMRSLERLIPYFGSLPAIYCHLQYFEFWHVDCTMHSGLFLYSISALLHILHFWRSPPKDKSTLGANVVFPSTWNRGGRCSERAQFGEPLSILNTSAMFLYIHSWRHHSSPSLTAFDPLLCQLTSSTSLSYPAFALPLLTSSRPESSQQSSSSVSYL